MENIQAKNLATGDTVQIPHRGKIKLMKMVQRTTWSVKFDGSDRRRYTFEFESIMRAERAADDPVPASEWDVLRFDRESGRTSVVALSSLFRVWDLRELPAPEGKVTMTREFYLSQRMRAGETIETSKAVYSMPQCPEDNEGFRAA